MQNMENKKKHDLRQDKRNRMLCLKVKENDLKAETMLLMENKGLLLNMINGPDMAGALEQAKYAGIEKKMSCRKAVLQCFVQLRHMMKMVEQCFQHMPIL